MLVQLIIGSAAILASMGVLVGFVSVAMRMLPAANSVLTNLNYPLIRLFILLSSAVILILAASTVCVWLWAILFQVLGVFDTLEEAMKWLQQFSYDLDVSALEAHYQKLPSS